MSRIKGRGNRQTELVMRQLLREAGITGWRRHARLFGKPDFSFSRQKVAVFVDGCFWHCCPDHSNIPVNNRTFWEKKLGSNRARDLLVTRTLRERGWTVLRFWEHEVRKDGSKCILKVANALIRPRAQPPKSSRSSSRKPASAKALTISRKRGSGVLIKS